MKILLAEIDFPMIPTKPLNYGSGIYVYHLAHARIEVADDNGVTGYIEAENEGKMYNIKSVYNDGEYYTACSSYSAMFAADKTFYFDYPNQMVYVRYEDDNPPDVQRHVRFGAAKGFCNKVDRNSLTGAYFQDIFFEPCLKTAGSITRKIDPLFWGIQALQSFTLTFHNSEPGEYNFSFDDWRDEDIFGQAARLLFGDSSDTYDKYEVVASGYVDEPAWDWKEYQVKVSDKRAMMTRKIPCNKFTALEYPGISADMVGKFKQVVYGDCLRVPLVPIGEIGTNWIYFITDTAVNPLSEISNLTVTRTVKDNEGHEVEKEVSVDYTLNQASGTLAIPKSYTVIDDVKEYEETPPDARCSVYTSIGIALTIEQELLWQYASIPYTPTFYNTTEWENERSKSTIIGLLIGKNGEQEELRKVLEEINNSNSSILYPTCDGKLTTKSFETNRTASHYIHPDEWIDKPKFKKPSKEYLTSVDIKYNRKWDVDEYETLHYDNYEQEVFDIYKVYASKTYDTLLLSGSASSKAQKIMEQSRRIGKTVTRTIPAITLNNDLTEKKNWKIDIEDLIIADHSRPGQAEEWSVWRILSNTFDPEKLTCKLDMKHIRDCNQIELDYLTEIGYRR